MLALEVLCDIGCVVILRYVGRRIPEVFLE